MTCERLLALGMNGVIVLPYCPTNEGTAPQPLEWAFALAIISAVVWH
jgi:hypothetical protein